MKREGDYAIIETVEEAACLSGWFLDQWCVANDDGPKVIRRQVLKAITLKEGDAVFDVDPTLPDYISPKYYRKWSGPIIKLIVKANALTIGKTVGELRDLLEWCKDATSEEGCVSIVALGDLEMSEETKQALRDGFIEEEDYV